MARRLPAPAPVLPGYTYIRPLGSGGFADVFLYEQAMPRRKVAVKVLLPDVASSDVRAMFLSEAMLMAQLSSHPAVLTVYEASISADGRPYLVMEYCPSSYGSRFREEAIPVAEVLNVAIAVGGALETAHRDNVLHRDIKPANILATSYGKPVLADFGIASTVAQSERQEARGMSIPWSAPEVISGETQGTVRTEVWAYAATVYTLLAGRSPFEVPGKENARADVQKRILGREPVRTTGRRDVPDSLEYALAQALSKDPSKRQPSILALLRAFQMVEAELGMRPTPLEIPTESVIDITALTTPSVDATTGQSTDGTTGGTGTGFSTSLVSKRRDRSSRALYRSNTATATKQGGDGVTVVRALGGEAETKANRRRVWIASGIAAAVAAIAATIVIVVIVTTTAAAHIPQVTNITATKNGSSYEFSWANPGLASNDNYLVQVDQQAGVPQRSTTFSLDGSQIQGRTCVTVTVVRDGKNGAPSNATCVGG